MRGTADPATRISLQPLPPIKGSRKLMVEAEEGAMGVPAPAQ